MAADFGYKKSYIKQYPDIFEKNMSNILTERCGTDTINLDQMLNDEIIEKVEKSEIYFLANNSIEINYSIPCFTK